MSKLVGRTFALMVNAAATLLLAFFAFGPSPYGTGLKVLFGLAALGAAMGAAASFAKLRQAIRNRA
jgi:hypothetical protein